MHVLFELEFEPGIAGTKDRHLRQQAGRSVQILGLMGDLVQTLSSAQMLKMEELAKLQKYVDDMQVLAPCNLESITFIEYFWHFVIQN